MEGFLSSDVGLPPLVQATQFSSDYYLDDRVFERVLGVPDKIHIPERYVPEVEVIDPQEELRRKRKAEAICRLLARAQQPQQVQFPQQAKSQGQRLRVGGSWSSSGVWSGTNSPQSLPVSPCRKQLPQPQPITRKTPDSSINNYYTQQYCVPSRRLGSSSLPLGRRRSDSYWGDPPPYYDPDPPFSSLSSGSSSLSSDREDFLHLQHLLAQEVTQRSRKLALVAVRQPKTCQTTPIYNPPRPPSPTRLPTIQQRESFFS